MTPPSARPGFGVRAARIWGLAWRMLLIASLGLIACGFTWDAYLDVPTNETGPLTATDGLIFLDLVLGVGALALYPLRRRWPLAIVSTIVFFAGASSFAAVAAAFAFVSLATRRRRLELAVVSTVFVASTMISSTTFLAFLDPAPWWQFLLFAVGEAAVLTVTGLYIGGRRQLLMVLQERADQIEREQDIRVGAAAAAERTRIARDMHDSLAHRLSLVSLHAGVLEYRTDLSPQQTRTAAGIVRENAHLAASDLREVLGILRDPSEAETGGIVRAPASIWEALDLLMHESRAADSPVELSIDRKTASQLNHLPTPSRGHLQRIIQEGLTNARKHAPWQPIDLRLAGSRGRRLSVSLANPIAADSIPGDARDVIPKLVPVASGFGLMGLNERVKVAGGELMTTRTDGAFTLQAWIPWPR